MKYDRAGKECKTNWPTGPLTHRTWRVEAEENMGNWPTFDGNEPRKIVDFDGNPTSTHHCGQDITTPKHVAMIEVNPETISTSPVPCHSKGSGAWWLSAWFVLWWSRKSTSRGQPMPHNTPVLSSGTFFSKWGSSWPMGKSSTVWGLPEHTGWLEEQPSNEAVGRAGVHSCLFTCTSVQNPSGLQSS